MSESDLDTAFRSIVEMIFNNWTALQLSVEHGMGGPQGRQAAAQFVTYIIDSFRQKAMIQWCPGLSLQECLPIDSHAARLSQSGTLLCFGLTTEIEIEEVEDILIDIMDSEFNTVCEDCSPLEVAQELHRVFHLCRTGNLGELQQISQQLQSSGCKLWLCRPQATEVAESCPSIDESARAETPPPQLMEVGDSDGWTVVSSRRNK